MVMTREEIMAMPAGPDLDRLVAEALGETEAEWHKFAPHRHCYSTDIYAAWKAWEAMPQNERGINCDSDKILLCGDDGVMVGYLRYPDDYYVKMDTEILATAPTVPLAICRAFLILKETGQ